MERRAIGRRQFVRRVAGALATTTLVGAGTRRSEGAGQVIVLDSGGPWQAAAKAAFYDDFERESGIRVVYAAGQTQGSAQLRAMVKAGRVEWDVINLGWRNLVQVGDEGLLEALDYGVIKTDGLLPGTTHKYALALDALAGIMAYNHEKFPRGTAPKTWADFWDVKRFPGRRGVGNRPFCQIEAALMADGIPADTLYPLDVERGLRKLNELKPHIVWWTTAAQQTQFILDGEVDLILGVNARLLVGIEKGAPYTLVWNQGIIYQEGWGIPKGAPNKAEAMKFLAFTTRPKAQAVFAQRMAYGPVNGQAYAFISPERARVLPTHPDNLKQMVRANEEWWSKNMIAVEQRWVGWRVE